MKIENAHNAELQTLKELIYDKCGFKFENFKQHLESEEYGACSFELNGRKIQYRVSKITPTKIGEFVTIWKRNKQGITEPFNVLDELDFIIITSKSDENVGQFIFPKTVLAEMGIITSNGNDGKRGIRVYPPWDNAVNKQAIKTQSWQIKYFVKIESNDSVDLKLVRKLLSLPENNG